MKSIVNSWLVWCVLALSIPAVPAAHGRPSQTPASQSITGVVVRVIDGDTVWLQTERASRPVKVRVVGIDAPEICQAGGTASRDVLRQRLLGKTVHLKLASARAHDDYGRTLGRLEFNGEDVGRWMVSSGHAWSYASRYGAGLYAAEQTTAARARKGLFAHANAENPRSFRRWHGTCYP